MLRIRIEICISIRNNPEYPWLQEAWVSEELKKGIYLYYEYITLNQYYTYYKDM